MTVISLVLLRSTSHPYKLKQTKEEGKDKNPIRQTKRISVHDLKEQYQKRNHQEEINKSMQSFRKTKLILSWYPYGECERETEITYRLLKI